VSCECITRLAAIVESHSAHKVLGSTENGVNCRISLHSNKLTMTAE
jgi:hypothetical protein